jgi:LPPG:FO 2-phospho-L-lactate transferase
VICVLAGGVGAAKFLAGLQQVVAPAEITAVVNVADDFVMHGLNISPDLDTVTYTLAGAVNPETGWGLRGETWAAMDALDALGGETWFRLGDRDLATHLYRTGRLAQGAPLHVVTAELAAAQGVGVRVLPVSDEPVRTVLTLADGGGEIDFQEYFVHRQHGVAVAGVRFSGDGTAVPAPGVLEAIAEADTVVVAPSNPIVSIGPVLAVAGVREALVARRERCVGVSPIVGGQALKGPADRLLRELGHDSSVVGVARLYRELCAALVVDTVDASLAGAVEAEGVRCVVAPTIMSDPERSAEVARRTLAAVAG